MSNSPGPLRTPTPAADLAKLNRPAPTQKTDRTWYRAEGISGGNWNGLFPYQLMVVDQKDKDTYVVHSDIQTGPFVFTLPIPPESMAISMPFAVQGDVTLGGYMEQWNGAPIRMIQLAGTTGVSFGRGRAPGSSLAFDFRNAVFAGTLQAATNTVNATTGLVHPTFIHNSHTQSEYDDTSENGLGSMTGWFQFRLLQYFFESYAELKKTKLGRNTRLAFATWKDEAVYLVTPITFDVHKDANSPLEYRYSIQLKAFKRVRLEKGGADIVQDYTPILSDPGKLQRALNALNQIRTVVQGAKKTIAAVGGDIERTIFEPIRQTTLLVKDLLSVPISVADLADSIIQDTKNAILQVRQTTNGVVRFQKNVSARFASVSQNARNINDNMDQLASELGDSHAGSQVGGGVSIVRTNLLATHPANSAFLSPSDNFDFFSQIQVGDLDLPPATQQKVAKERARVRGLTRLDFQTMRDDVQASADAFAAAIGAGNATYNRIYGREAPATTIIDAPTDEDFNTLFALNQLVIEMNRFVVTSNQSPKLNAIAAVAGLAARSGMAFRIPLSKFAVPFPYGSTLEQLATRYLDNPDRWIEIATLNGLQEPYVDEEGFQLPLLVNGQQNVVFVGNAERIFVGQPIWVGSDTTVRTRRMITKIDQLSPVQFMVTVDGEANMDEYTVLANARVEAFLPNTVNSQMVIYIPSDIVPKDQDFTSRTVPGVNEYDSLIAVGGIDLLLTPKNDLVITADGDSRWAVGLTNIIQKVRIALSVVQGTLNRHPDFGLPIEVGMSIADLSAADVVRAAQGMFAGDPTFTGIQAAQISINGPIANLNLAVQVAGTSQVIPISAEVSR